MRIQIAIAIAASIAAVEASASSILIVEDSPSAMSRSVMMIPDATPSRNSVTAFEADEIARVSSSVLAVGKLPAASGEHVSAINGNSGPSVLRGGVFGEALPAPAPVVETAPVKELSRPAQRAKERAERRAIRDAIRFGEPLPQKAEVDQEPDT